MKLSNNNVLKGAVCFVSLLASGAAIAEPRTEPTTINIISTAASGNVLVNVTDRTLANPGAGNNGVTVCTNSSFRISAGTPGANSMIATALTAAASGQEVVVEISSNATSCGFQTEINSIFIESGS